MHVLLDVNVSLFFFSFTNVFFNVAVDVFLWWFKRVSCLSILAAHFEVFVVFLSIVVMAFHLCSRIVLDVLIFLDVFDVVPLFSCSVSTTVFVNLQYSLLMHK